METQIDGERKCHTAHAKYLLTETQTAAQTTRAPAPSGCCNTKDETKLRQHFVSAPQSQGGGGGGRGGGCGGSSHSCLQMHMQQLDPRGQAGCEPSSCLRPDTATMCSSHHHHHHHHPGGRWWWSWWHQKTNPRLPDVCLEFFQLQSTSPLMRRLSGQDAAVVAALTRLDWQDVPHNSVQQVNHKPTPPPRTEIRVNSELLPRTMERHVNMRQSTFHHAVLSSPLLVTRDEL